MSADILMDLREAQAALSRVRALVGTAEWRADAAEADREEFRTIAEAAEAGLAALRARVRALAEEWEQMSDEDPFDPGNPGGYATDLRAALAGDA